MNLPDDSIGISDILAWRDCARRMSFSMKRHTEEGEPPEAAIEHAYGSCIHDVVHAIEDRDMDDDLAIQLAFDKWGWALEPDDLDRLRKDIETYRTREMIGVRTLAAEGEFRVPLMERDGRMIYFRFRLDRLWQRMDNAAIFVHKDYKSSKWRKSEEEVHKDLQMWAYNWGIHEFFPECQSLIQVYDQLSYGQVPTRKSDEQRRKIGEWLRREATAILNDDSWQDDGLLKPKFNDWCPWCPIAESCQVVEQLSDFALTRIDALTPDDRLLAKVGVDATGIETYVERLNSVTTAQKVLDRFEGKVKDVLRKLPTSERERLGYKLSQRRKDQFDPEAMRQAHAILGDDFYALVGITKTRLDSLFDDDPRADEVRNLARKEVAGETLRKHG